MKLRNFSGACQKKLLCVLCMFVVILTVSVAGVWYGYSLKVKRIPSPTVAEADAILYYRGLGFTDDHIWYGKYRVKLIDYLGNGTDNIVMERTYYPNGMVESEYPKKGGMDADGIHKCYHENGTLAEELGIRVNPEPNCICCTFMRHGIHREYDENGKLTYEKWFIDDKECTKSQWADRLKYHPEDIMYGR